MTDEETLIKTSDSKCLMLVEGQAVEIQSNKQRNINK